MMDASPLDANPVPLYPGRLIVISGPSGVGKGTLCKALLKQHPDWQWSVSATSRPPRPGEVDGTDYWFFSRLQFEEAIAQDDFFEWAEYNGNYYGTPVKPVMEALNQGTTILLEIDVQGALQVRQRLPNALLVMIHPPSLDILAQRLEQRGTNTPNDIQQRLAIARQELAQATAFDITVVNDDLTACLAELETLLTT